MFRRIVIHNWRQFKHINITLHPKLTILTGANGAGKTTILQLLNRHLGWNLLFISTPKFTKEGIRKYWTGFWGSESEKDVQAQNYRDIGQIEYVDKPVSKIKIPLNAKETFNVEIEGMQQVYGVFVPSHRPPYTFQKVDNIPTELDAKQQIFQTYLNELISRFNPGHIRVNSPTFRIKSALMSLATFGYGNIAVERNEDAIETFEGFQDILKKVLPPELGFRGIKVRVPDILLETNNDEFSFDAVSGGIASLIDITWQIYMYSLLHQDFVVVIDEPETHLHPALQQRLLPDLIEAFPKTQFIIATHNPFIVTSVPDSNVYVLDFNNEQRVESVLLDMVNKAGSANEILRKVLGVPHTLPIWVDNKLQDIIRNYSDKEINEATLTELRKEMEQFGLDHLFPETLGRVLEQIK